MCLAKWETNTLLNVPQTCYAQYVLFNVGVSENFNGYLHEHVIYYNGFA